MYKVFRLPLILLIVVSSLGCASVNSRLTEDEKRIGTSNKGDWLLHRVPAEPYALGLRVPGYIIGFEKTSRDEKLGLGKLSTDDDKGWAEAGVRMSTQEHGLEKLSSRARSEQVEQRNKNIAGWLSDPQHAFLTHIVRYSYTSKLGMGAVWPEFLYNAYEERACTEGEVCQELHSKGLQILDGDTAYPLPEDCAEPGAKIFPETCGKTLPEMISHDAQSATHIIVYCMGWNTDQQESIRNFNSLIGTLLNAAGPKSEFRPLVIGITWDSLAGKGLMRPFTYPFKANDADEIGTVWASRLLWNTLGKIKDDTDSPKIVLIGHSFGARVLTQALFAKQYLPKLSDSDNHTIDLAIMLQGAVSINRFLPGRGKEGAPFADYTDSAGKIAFTWSTQDKANPIALYISGAKLAGGSPGFRRASEHDDVFDFRRWRADGWEDEGCSGECEGKEILMVDASEVISFETHGKGGKAHSDIYNQDVARLTWELIQEFAPIQ